jgi:hypothetical protein
MYCYWLSLDLHEVFVHENLIFVNGGVLTNVGQYIGESMVSIFNINNGIKEPTCGYQDCYTSEILIFGGHVKVRESFVYMSDYLGQCRSKPY